MFLKVFSLLTSWNRLIFTFVLQLPGKRGLGPSGWAIQAKLQIYLWLGLLKHKKNSLSGIPKGYEITQEIRNIERPRALPPSVIHYVDKHVNINFFTVIFMILLTKSYKYSSILFEGLKFCAWYSE